MKGFLYGAVLQWRLDIRSRSMVIACYMVPLLFFALMGGIFTSVMPQMRETLIPSMIVMGVSMGAFIGLPPSLVETYGGEVKKLYRANGVPLFMGAGAMVISAFVHLFLMCLVILLLAPVMFGAEPPKELPAFFLALIIFIGVSLSVGLILGLGAKSQSRLTVGAQLLFLPSIMLSGIMFPAEMLPKGLEILGKAFPASWGYELMQNGGLRWENLWYLLLVLGAAMILSCILIKAPASSK